MADALRSHITTVFLSHTYLFFAAQATPSLSTLVTAVVAGGLANVLSTTSPLTVFAPNNQVRERERESGT